MVNFVTRNGIFFQRLVSPIGRNAQWCCDSVGIPLYNMHGISKDSVFHYVYSALPDWVVISVSVVHELLQVRWNQMCLQLLSSVELDFIVDALCTGHYPRRARSALSVDIVLTLDVCMFVCMYVSALERKRLIGMT